MPSSAPGRTRALLAFVRRWHLVWLTWALGGSAVGFALGAWLFDAEWAWFMAALCAVEFVGYAYWFRFKPEDK